MDRSSGYKLLGLFDQIILWRRRDYIIPEDPDKVRFHWSGLHLEVVRDYFSNFSKTCDLRPGMIFSNIVASFTQELQKFFMVPRLEKFHESNNSIKKYQLVEGFISFLLQLLYHKTDSIIGPYKDRINNLEKELRFLLTVLGGAPFILCDEYEEFQTLLAEFEAVANEAGSLVHSLFFSTDRASGKMNEGIGVVLNHIDLLKANIMKFLNLLSFISISAYIPPKTSFVESLLIVNSLIHDLEDLTNRKDNLIADVRDQIKILHQGLIFLQSSIKDIGSPRPSEIGELNEPLMRIGDMAHEAEYLIFSFLAGDAPLWYLINRLTDINHKIEIIGTELQEIIKKYKFGDLKVAKYFSAQLSLQDKRNTEVDDVTVGFEDMATDILHQLAGGTGRVQVISIFGMPGLDSQIDKDRIQKMEEESLAEHIYKTLKGRRYLIVMDDIWHSNVWNDLRR